MRSKKVKFLAEGTPVRAVTGGGVISGTIVGITDEQGEYVIKIGKREGKGWMDYPYSCCVLPAGYIYDDSNKPRDV